jgi:hypothetical protein
VIRAATVEVIQAVVGKLPLPYSPVMRGVTNGGATIIYDGWTPNSVQVHVYSESPKFLFDPTFVREFFRYPFDQCGKSLVYTVTPGNAEGSLAVSKALGFREMYRIKDGWQPGVDMVLKEMRREECRYLRMH